VPRVICLGELLVDFVSTEPDVPLSELPGFVGAAGGAPANVAVGLAKLGLSAGFIGKVGADPFGEFLRQNLAEPGVDTSHLLTAADARTTLAFIATRSDGRKDICFYRHPGADMLLAPEDIDPDYIRSAQALHIGSVSLSRSPAREATVRAVDIARDAGLLISFDPNWRPTLWDDPAEGHRWIWELIPRAHVVKLAEEEWEFVAGAGSLEEGSRRILEAGPELVIVTRGPEGCYFDDGVSREQVPGFEVDVVDTLGAGDAFVAAALSRLLEKPRGQRLPREALREMALWANAAGALATLNPGVIPALPAEAEVEEFLETHRPR